MRATIVVDVTEAVEVQRVDAWFTNWRAALTFCSEDLGCGCCVRIWNVEGSPAAIAALPEAVRTASDWTAA